MRPLSFLAKPFGLNGSGLEDPGRCLDIWEWHHGDLRAEKVFGGPQKPQRDFKRGHVGAKAVNQKNQFKNFFFTKLHFLQFQKWPKMNFWTGKKFKNAISRKKIFDLFDFTSFFAWTFLNFLARCEHYCTVRQIQKW